MRALTLQEIFIALREWCFVNGIEPDNLRLELDDDKERMCFKLGVMREVGGNCVSVKDKGARQASFMGIGIPEPKNRYHSLADMLMEDDAEA